MAPTETMVVRFEDEHHYNLHRLLTDAGCTFQVTRDLQVGRYYKHPKKPIEVLLEEGGDEDSPWLEFKVLYRDKVQTDDDYSEAEWKWMTNVGANSPETDLEVLRRELHILINIRPHIMTHTQIEAAG